MTQGRQYILVTGATGAIGKEIAKALYQKGYNLILGCRSEEKADKFIARLRKAVPGQTADVRFLRLDLEEESSLTEASNALASIRLLGIINNAGVKHSRFTTLPNGVEATIGVNFLHTAMLNEMLKKRVVRGGAIVFTTSLTRFLWRPDRKTRDNMREGFVSSKLKEVGPSNFTQLGTYGLSKRLLTDYAAALSERLRPEGIRVNCADPGVVNSGMIKMDKWFDRLADIFFRPFIRSPKHGAVPALRAFESPETARIFCRRAIHKI